MAIDLKTLGAKLSRHRDHLLESIDEVSLATGIAVERLMSIEAGNTRPTGDEVLILADHYRCDFNFFISNEQLAPFERVETLYRAHGNDFGKADRRAIQEFLYLCETEEFLIRALGRSRRSFSYVPTGTYFKAQGADAASSLRAELGHKSNEVSRDLFSEFRGFGVHVFRRKLGNSNISGLFIMHPWAGKCILVNHSEDIYRQRFSAAHEMAHAVFDSAQGASVSYVHGRPKQSDMLELRANRFASSFLMPPEFLAKLPDPNEWTDASARHWANELRVSCSALAVSLKEADLVSEEAFDRIRKLRVASVAKVDPELPNTLNTKQRERKARLLEMGLSDHFVGLCFDGYIEGAISLGRLSEAMLCGHTELAELAVLYGRNLNGH